MGGYGAEYSYDTTEDIVKKSASAYNTDQGREYKMEETKAIIPPPLDRVLVTKAKLPIVIAIDVTGSMRELPKLIFEKLCILYNETLFFLPEDLKKHFEISFVALGDAYSDKYPLQVTDFDKGAALDKNIKNLYPEGGGGGQARETYELVAYFYLNHCEMPKALTTVRPMLIFIGDEGYYSKVSRAHVKQLVGDPPDTDLITLDLFEELKKKFDVYILRVKYEYDSNEEALIQSSWEEALGKDRVIIMETPRRVVDIILGLIAANVDSFDAYKERITIRQTPEQVTQVFTSLDGLRSGRRGYMFRIEALKCPSCGAALEKPPTFDQPEKCPYCQLLLVRI